MAEGVKLCLEMSQGCCKFAGDMDRIENFVRLVERMREQQKEYFRTRSVAALAESRRLEKEVDQEVRLWWSGL